MARKKTPRLTRFEAESLLELTGSYSYKDFQKAYRAAVKVNHPDMGGDAATMVRVNQAKETIEYYFGDDKSQVLICATSQEESAAEQAAAENSYQETSTSEETEQPPEPHSPLWERYQAQQAPNYEARQKMYWTKHTEPGCFINTPYGYAQMPTTSGFDDWEGTINVPFAFSDTDSYEYWRKRNLEAWRKADEGRKPRQRKKKPVIEPPACWTGLEFITGADDELPWVAEAREYQARSASTQARPSDDEVKTQATEAEGSPDGISRNTWVAQHQGLAGWLFVLLVYMFLPGLSSAVCVGLFGSIESAMIPAFAIQIGGLAAAIAFRKRAVQWVMRVQNQVLGRA